MEGNKDIEAGNGHKLLWAELRHLREILKERNKARKLQAKEYERRLVALNHEAARLALMVTSEMFDEVVDQIRKEIREMRAELKLIELWKSNQEGKQARAQWIAIGALVVSAIGLILAFTKT